MDQAFAAIYGMILWQSSAFSRNITRYEPPAGQRLIHGDVGVGYFIDLNGMGLYSNPLMGQAFVTTSRQIKERESND
jgi:hypothetical protein